MIYPLYLGLNDNGRSTYEPRSPEVIVLTDQPDVTASTPDFQGLPSAAVDIEAHIGHQPVELLALHTLSPGSSQRHLVRDEELNAVAHWLETATRPAIAFGDFNTTYFSPDFRRPARRRPRHLVAARVRHPGHLAPPVPPRRHRHRPVRSTSAPSPRWRATAAPASGSEHRTLLVRYALAAR